MRARSHFQSFVGFALAAACALVLLLRSSARVPLTWDEGDAFNRGEQTLAWLEAFARSPVAFRDDDARRTTRTREAEALAYFSRFEDRRALLSREALSAGFEHAIYREGHPSGASLAIATGELVARGFGATSGVVSHRLGFLLLFSFAVGFVFFRARESFGTLGGALAVVGVLSCPRVFGHAQLAGGDSLLISSWLIAWSLFDFARRSTFGAACWGVAVGVSFCAKFSGWLIVAPFAFVAVFERFRARGAAAKFERRALARTTFGVVVGLAVFFLANPPLWARPIDGFLTFCRLNMTREGFDVPVFFFGELYSPSRPAPWWNGFFWLFATTPVFALALAPAVFCRRARRVATLGRARIDASFRAALALAATLPLVRVAPGLPIHDGARLLISSCAFAGLLAGLGAATVVGAVWRAPRLALSGRVRGRAWRLAIGVGAVAALLVGTFDVARSSPQYLSFYNALVGGTSGAAKRGLEATYYWDSLDAPTLARLAQLQARRRAEGRPDGVLFGAFSTQTLDYMRRWKILGTDDLATISDKTFPTRFDRFGFYATQRRPSGWSPLDAALRLRAKPLVVKRYRDPLLPGDVALGAPILEIYAIEDVARVLAELDGDGAP